MMWFFFIAHSLIIIHNYIQKHRELKIEPLRIHKKTLTCIYFVAEKYAKLKMSANYSQLQSSGKEKIRLSGPNKEEFLQSVEVICHTI